MSRVLQHFAMRLLLVVMLVAAIPAQRDAAPPAQNRGTLVDAVIATVNDSAIMWSSVQTAAASRIRAEVEKLGTTLSPALVGQIRDHTLEQEILRHRMAQAAKSFGPLTPDQVEQLLLESLERDRRDEERDFGSLTEYTRQLQRSGRSWPSHLREQRIEKLHDFAEQLSVSRRLARQTNLFVTPRMLRETYQQMVDYFVHPAEARIVQIAFLGPDAKAHAEAAAEAWRKEPLDVRELAARFQPAQPIAVVNAASLTAQLDALRTFALAGPENAVSSPIAVGDAFHVARVVQFAAARNGRYEDPEVQAELRRICAERVIVEFQQQAYARARERTQVHRVLDTGR